MTRRRMLLLLFALALLLRAAYVLTLDAEIFWYDGQEYARLAEGIRAQHAYLAADGSPSAWWPPGYPFFLSLIGGSVTATRLLQALLGALAVLLAFGIGRRLHGEGAGLLAAAFTAIYPLYIYAAGAFYPVALQTLLLGLVFLLCLDFPDGQIGWRNLAAGFLAAWAALVSASALPALMLAAAWIFLEGWRRKRAGRAALAALIFVLPIALVVGSWTMRNWREMGRPVMVSTNGGYNLWLGNFPGVKASTGNRTTPAMDAESRRIGAAEGEAERDRAYFARGIEYMKVDPARTAALSAGKALNLWRLWPRPMSSGDRGFGLREAASLLSYGLLLPFALFGLGLFLSRRPAARLALLFFLAYTLLHAFFIAKVRFRLPLDLLIIALAAGGIDYLLARLGWFERFRRLA